MTGRAAAPTRPAPVPPEAERGRAPARRILAVALALTWLVVTSWAATGIGTSATYSARVTADEPQYLLSAISLAEDHDLDIADELAERRWLAFHSSQLPEQTKLLSGGRRLSPCLLYTSPSPRD